MAAHKLKARVISLKSFGVSGRSLLVYFKYDISHATYIDVNVNIPTGHVVIVRQFINQYS